MCICVHDDCAATLLRFSITCVKKSRIVEKDIRTREVFRIFSEIRRKKSRKGAKSVLNILYKTRCAQIQIQLESSEWQT